MRKMNELLATEREREQETVRDEANCLQKKKKKKDEEDEEEKR